MEYFQQLVTLGVPQELAGQLSVNGLTYPMSDEWILLSTEQEEINQATDMFNATIEQLVTNAGLAFFDVKKRSQLTSLGLLGQFGLWSRNLREKFVHVVSRFDF